MAMDVDEGARKVQKFGGMNFSWGLQSTQIFRTSMFRIYPHTYMLSVII